MKLLMLSGDTSLAQGREAAFYHTLKHFAPYWDRIDVICPPAANSAPRTVHRNVFVHPGVGSKALQVFYVMRKGAELITQHQHDLIVSHDYGVFYNGISGSRLSQSSGIPYVSEIHHVEGYPRATTLREVIYRTLAMQYIRWAGRHAISIRVVNQIEMPTLLRSLRVPEHKILVLPSLYLDFDIFKPANEDQTQRYDVLFVGRLVSNKGIMTILDAVAKVQQAHPNVQLGILGEGPLRRSVERRIKALGLQDNVTLIERVLSPEEIVSIYQQAQMLVCASTAEGGPRVTVEAMACGVPVISTAVGIMPELIQDGENGLLFHWDAGELAKKIRLLIEDARLRRTMGEKGRQAVQRFRAETVIEQYAKAYQALIQQTGKNH